MPIEVRERFGSPRLTRGRNPSVEAQYNIKGTNDQYAAQDALEAEAPLLYDLLGDGTFFLTRDSAGVEQIGDGRWVGLVRYGLLTPSNSAEFTFDTGGGVQHITQSLETIWARLPDWADPGQFAPNHDGAIGVTKDSVEGCDIVVPVYQFSETHYKPASFVDSAYKQALFSLTGKVNAGVFRELPVGSVLFTGARGAKRGAYGDWAITYSFAAAPNLIDATIGPFQHVWKEGWQYLWIRYEDSVNNNYLVKRPAALYVEQVYKYGDFGALQIGQ